MKVPALGLTLLMVWQSGVAHGMHQEQITPTEPAQNQLQSAPLPLTEPDPKGAIIMYRGSSVVGAAVACPIRYKGQELVELGRGKYAEWSVPAGWYILANGTSSVEVAVSTGETRYVRCQIKSGMLSGRADLQIIDEESFAKNRADYKKKEVKSPF